MSEDRPEWVKCVGRNNVADAGLSWCGRDVRMEWHFNGADHAAENGRQGGRLVACPECTEAIVQALRAGHDALTAREIELLLWQSLADEGGSATIPNVEDRPERRVRFVRHEHYVECIAVGTDA